MISLAHEIYSRQEIIDALHGKHGSRSIDFRFDLLDKEDRKIGDVSHLVQAGSSSIDMENQAEIHRTAKFNMRDDGSVNFLSDRIQPWAVLNMPDIRRPEVVYEEKTGENLAIGTASEQYVIWNNGTITYSNHEGAKAIKVQSNGVAGTFGIQQSTINRKMVLQFDETLTYSFDVRGNVEMNYVYLMNTSGGNQSIYMFSEAGKMNENTFTKMQGTFKKNSASPFSFVMISSRDGGVGKWFEVKNIKVEKGSIVTPWSPAPADIGMAEYQEKWMRKTIKPKIIPSQNIEFPLGVFLLSTPEKSYQNRNIYRSIEAYDKLQILLDDGFTARYVADEGEYVTDVVNDIIRATGITQINIERSDVQLPTWFSWDPDVSRLEVVNQLLQAINYEKIYVDEYGYFTSRPYRSPAIRSAEYDYKTDAWSVMTPGATALQDFFAVPNQWVGVISEPDRVPLTYTYENLNEDSPTSIPARGRTVTKYIDVDAADIESLQGIVQKQAFEDSQVYTEMAFQTAIMPMHSHNDIYSLQHDILGVNAKFQELSWSMTLSAGATMSHTAREIINV